MNKKLLRIFKKENAEAGVAAVEMAITLPVMLGLIFGTLGLAGWYFQQTAVAISASSAARAAGIREGNIAAGQEENLRLLRALGAGDAAGGTDVSVDPLRRAVIVRTEAQSTFSLPFVQQALQLLGGSFYRRWDFYPGPPNPWE